MTKDFTLPKANIVARAEILGLQDLPQVLALQDATRAGLSDEHKNFVLPQPSAYFEKFLSRQSGLMIGIRAGDLLVAQMVVMGTLTLEEAVARNAITRNEVSFHHAEMTDLIVVMKSMAVHPDWRGNELSQSLLETALELPFVRATDHIFAQMSVENVRSWELFLRHGFGIIAAALDPTDLKPRFIVQKPALGFSFHHTAGVNDVDAIADFAGIMRLTGREALIGQMESDFGLQLVFFAGADTAAAWSDEPSTAGGNI